MFLKEIVIFDEISLFPKMPLLKRDTMQMSQCGKLTEKPDTDRGSGNGKLYSAKLCKYAFTLCLQKQYLENGFCLLLYCTDSALNVLL